MARLKTAVELDQDWEQIIADRVTRTKNNEFVFFGESRQVSANQMWSFNDVPKLWSYHLNYFDFAVDLAVRFDQQNDESSYHHFRKLVTEWQLANPVLVGIPWDVYPTTLRLFNWLVAYSSFQKYLATDSELNSQLTKALHLHAQVVEKWLETSVGGNHLLENRIALYAYSQLADSPRTRTSRSELEQALRQEYERQILNDGGHYERVPGYHCLLTYRTLMLTDLMGNSLPDWLLHVAQKMVASLHMMTLDDGWYPSFGDSWREISPSPASVVSYAKELGIEPRAQATPVTDLPDFGITMIRSGNSQMVIDNGEFGSNDQPGHAHSDNLSYELLVNRDRVIIDSGTSTYEPGARRLEERGITAHNSLAISGEDIAEHWKSFRVGRRPKLLIRGTIRADAYVIAYGAHDGYSHLPGEPIAARLIASVGESMWIVVDQITGDHQHDIESRLHLHPSFVASIQANNEIELRSTESTQRLTFKPFGFENAQIIESGYSSSMGIPAPNSCVILEGSTLQNKVLGYAIHTESSDVLEAEQLDAIANELNDQLSELLTKTTS